MRTTYDQATVRLYHLDSSGEGGAAHTLFYGPLSEALRLAEQQSEDVQDQLYIATDNDVVSWRDLSEN